MMTPPTTLPNTTKPLAELSSALPVATAPARSAPVTNPLPMPEKSLSQAMGLRAASHLWRLQNVMDAQLAALEGGHYKETSGHQLADFMKAVQTEIEAAPKFNALG